MFGGDMVIGKNRDRNYKPKLKIVRDRTSYGVEVCYVIDADTDWTEGMNEYGIGVVKTALFVKRDEKDYDKSKKTNEIMELCDIILSMIMLASLRWCLRGVLLYSRGPAAIVTFSVSGLLRCVRS